MFIHVGRLSLGCFLLFLLIASRAFGQEADLTGEWVIESNEEDGGIGGGGDRGGGAPAGVVTETLGNYLGLAINEAGRQRAISWDGSQYSHPAIQVKTPTMQFFMRAANARFRFEKIRDDVSGVIIAYKVIGGWGAGDRMIWLDGRPHPPDYARHTWDGFSTGKWENGILVVTTDHIVDGMLRRNRAPASRNAVVTEYWIRRGDRMTLVQFVDDPAYLEEPHVVTSDFILGVNAVPARRFLKYWDTAEEIPWPKGYVPHYPLGTHHTDVADILGIPLAATEGGKETMYPEYRLKLKKMMSESRSAPGSNTNSAATK